MRNIQQYPPSEADVTGAIRFSKQQVEERAPFSTFGPTLEAIRRVLARNPELMAEVVLEIGNIYGVSSNVQKK
jgi:hypothetical protein